MRFEFKDGTEPFQVFHSNSKRAYQHLATLPSRPAEKNPSKVIQRFRELRQKWRKQG